MKNRIIFLMYIFCAACLIVTVRFFSLQSGNASELKKAAAAQQSNSVLLFKKRGNITDRNGIPFTNRTSKTVVVFEPLALSENGDLLEYFSEISGISSEKIRMNAGFGRTPMIFSITQEIKEALLSSGYIDTGNPGVSFVEVPERYDSNMLCHITGYLNGYDGTGSAGLEEYYENYLKGNDVYISVSRDALNMPIKDSGMKLHEYNSSKAPYDVKLTIDYHIQKIVEEEMDANIEKGAVVVMDVRNGDILAMASRPLFDRSRVAELIKLPYDTSLFNRAVADYSPGSVFKITGLTVAIENDLNPAYRCTGKVSFPGLSFSCYGGYAHGFLDLDDAFRLSCNSYFIRLAINTGMESILEVAYRFGFGIETGIYRQGQPESAGSLPAPAQGRSFSYGETANTAIGQGEVSVTPVQVAAAISAIANKGIKNPVNLADSILDSKGMPVKSLRNEGMIRIMTEETAKRAGEIMRQVTSYGGTGSRANIDDVGGAAGKTGSAEAYDIYGNKTVHAWFAGYFPYDNPCYAISVFIEEGGTGGDMSAPVFASIARRILSGR